VKKNPDYRRDFRAEDQARTGHPNLGKVVLYQMSYFRFLRTIKRGLFRFGSAKIGFYFIPPNFFSKILFVLRSVLGTRLNFNFRLAFVAAMVQTVTTA
jgi:hypothetical protein